jgi:SAM-dependent methyltransferase
MVEAASRRTADLDNVTVERANALTMPLPRATYDAVVSIATFHHLPLGRMLRRLRPALRPGGVIVLLDLYEERTLLDRLVGLAAVPASAGLRVVKLASRRPSAAEKAAWRGHAPHEAYRPLAEIRHLARRALPGARVRRHLLWRYSLVWRKPASAS